MLSDSNLSLEEKTVHAYVLSNSNSMTIKGLGSSLHFLSEFLNTTYKDEMADVKELKRNLMRIMDTIKKYSDAAYKIKAEVRKLEKYNIELDTDIKLKEEFKLYMEWLANKKEYDRWVAEKKRALRIENIESKRKMRDKVWSEFLDKV